ncbi:hypothetical protein FA15DRAFT_756561 [Coprinopsis marcescibilis]|uniref:F-box domain-containing protein n=1 Tax=Coprinopsis marcescibilis TaxID=230819 RepID=A0A5C3KV99_COPMA|nr:hypothetical protein FA15DRAFT_756561 [Coprinopsis marcescibilis]
MANVPWSLASHINDVISSKGGHQLSLARTSTTTVELNLTSLPEELIIAVMEFAEWSDILRLRCCCKVMHSTSRARSIWVALLHRYYLTVFPRPFLLPKPLEHCTSSELEVLITGWFRDVRDFSNEISPPQTSTLQMNSAEHRKLGTIPGGRFMLYSAYQGSVYYQDPQSIPNTPPTMLIRSPFHETLTKRAVIMNFSFEPLLPRNSGFLSLEALEDQWFPRSLNLVLTWNDYGNTYRKVEETVIEVWTLLPQVVCGELVGYLSKRLSSFNEDPYGQMISCAILGDKVAYGMSGNRGDDDPAVVVVNWAGLTRGSFPGHRIYFSIFPTKDLTLLPDDRIMVVYSLYVQIWKLGQGTPSSSLPPSKRQRAPFLDPAWKESFEHPIRFRSCTSTPFFIRNSVRIVIPTVGGLYGIVLPCFAKGSGGDRPIEVVHLVQGQYTLADSDKMQWYGYRKGASVFHRRLALQYSWPDDLQTPFAGIAHPIPDQYKAWISPHFYFNESLNCIQSLDDYTSKYHVVSLNQPVN